jgi:formate/nitrite transporter
MMYSPKEIAHNYIATGSNKAGQKAGRLFVLAILAGMFIALASVGATTASVSITSPSLAKLVGALMFPTGLAMTLIAGSELFTGNCLIIIPVLTRDIRVGAMLRNWVIVYIGNFVGGLLVSAIVVYGHTFSLFDNQLAAAAIHTAVGKVELGFGDALLRGVLCNFLVCVAVWMAYAAKDVTGKVAGLFLPVMVFVLCGYEHSVANMYYISAGIMASVDPRYAAAVAVGENLSALTWGALVVKNLIPVTIGNIIGGAGLIGLPYWYVYLRGGDSDKTGAGHAAAVSKKKKR